MTLIPTFQPQNPAINGYYLGWSSCTSYASAMAASYDRQVAKRTTGEAVRRRTGDTIGGTTLAQNDDAVRSLTGVDLDVRYRYPWADFASKINAGYSAVLQGWYAPIAATKFDAGGGFSGNHAIFVPPGWGAMDPLADGRRSGIYKYHGEAYPQSLLKTFAGQLNIGSGRIVRLGSGLVYAAFTRPIIPVTYRAMLPTGAFWVYTVVNGSITRRTAETRGGGSSVPCTSARLYSWPGHSSKSLVKVTKGIYEGRYVSSQYAHVA